jgi:rhodanese-related sulfurtransferase
MSKKILCVFVAVLALVAFATVGFSQQNQPPKDEKKHTALGKYATAMETYLAYRANPEKIIIIDVRTPEEYSFIGHPPMSFNLPSMLWTGKFSAEKKDYVLEDNAEFETIVKSLYKPDDNLYLMCRSGHRSATAVNRLAKIGFINVYSVVDGFEGDKVSDEDSYYKGKRMKDGWRNAGLPWTYDLDAKLVYMPPNK